MKKMMAPEEIKKEIEKSLDRLYDRDEESTPIMKYKGIPFSALTCQSDALSRLHLLELHKDDVIISAYPCSGTHWMWEVTSMLLKSKAERIQGVKEELMLELTPQNKFADIPPPRVFNTHLQPQFLPKTVLSQNKIIFLVRNPKDVVVSYYKHTFGLYYKEYNGTFPSFFEMFMEKNLPFGDIFDFMRKWWPIVKDNPNCLVVYYEKASRNLQETVCKIGDFLGRAPNPELAAAIAELCTFDNMKKTKTVTMNNKTEKELWKPNYSFYRTGKVATWKEWLTVSQNERIDSMIKTELENCDIPITYTI